MLSAKLYSGELLLDHASLVGKVYQCNAIRLQYLREEGDNSIGDLSMSRSLLSGNRGNVHNRRCYLLQCMFYSNFFPLYIINVLNVAIQKQKKCLSTTQHYLHTHNWPTYTQTSRTILINHLHQKVYALHAMHFAWEQHYFSGKDQHYQHKPAWNNMPRNSCYCMLDFFSQ